MSMRAASVVGIVWVAILLGTVAPVTDAMLVNPSPNDFQRYSPLNQITKQNVAVLTGDGVSHTWGPLGVVPEIKPAGGHNANYVFALP